MLNLRVFTASAGGVKKPFTVFLHESNIIISRGGELPQVTPLHPSTYT